jgi:hypothetical protein
LCSLRSQPLHLEKSSDGHTFLLVHRIFTAIKRILPDRVAAYVRGTGTALLTPFYFAYDTGHFRSSLRSKAFDKHGVPIPWYTYPAIQLLRTKSFAGKRILEFGAGQSTIWWAQQAASVISFENNPEWYRYISPQLPPNATVHLVDVQLSTFEELIPAGMTFDVIIVDGLERAIAAKKSLSVLADGGLLILDNAEMHWANDKTYPIIDLLRYAGYSRVDLYGYCPANILPHCTSFFFRGKCFLFDAADHPISMGTLNRYEKPPRNGVGTS